jgi:hypothetical protein
MRKFLIGFLEKVPARCDIEPPLRGGLTPEMKHLWAGRFLHAINYMTTNRLAE